MIPFLGNVPAVYRFELRRALRPGQLIWWSVLTIFPVFIITMVRLTRRSELLPDQGWAFLLFGLVPMLTSMLGTFLWTTTAVSSELEEKSWVYLANRPNGSSAVLIGKFLAAVTWVLTTTLAGLTAAMLISLIDDKFAIWWPLALGTLLSVPTYAAIFTFLGCLFPRRAMVLGIFYSLTFEVFISMIPAIINQVTMQYHLRMLMLSWLPEIDERGLPRRLRRRVLEQFNASDAEVWFHLLVLGTVVVSLLIISIVAIRWREFSQAEEPDI